MEKGQLLIKWLSFFVSTYMVEMRELIFMRFLYHVNDFHNSDSRHIEFNKFFLYWRFWLRWGKIDF